MLRRLYDKTMAWADHPRAVLVLFAVAFVESSVFPIPPDVLLLPMILANRSRAFYYAAVCTAGSVLGGLAGYFIGYALFDSIGAPVLEFYGKSEHFANFQGLYNEHGWWLVFGAGLTPFPYKVITIASGLTQLPLGMFIVASIVGRGIRFFLLAALLWKFGAPIKAFIEKYFAWVSAAFFILLVGGFYAITLI